MGKECVGCKKSEVIKYGYRLGKQCYRCKGCGYQYTSRRAEQMI